MENALTAHSNQIDAVICANDGTAGGAVQALQEQGLAGKVPTCGQDADLVACQRVAEGTQTVTVFKDVRILADTAMIAAVELAKGKSIEHMINGKYINEEKGIEQNAIFVDVIPVTKDNLYEVIVQGGFHSLEDVYRNIPGTSGPTGSTVQRPRGAPLNSGGLGVHPYIDHAAGKTLPFGNGGDGVAS